MLKWFLRRQIAAFEREWNYDASYIREIIDADPRAMIAFGKVQSLSRYRKDIPLAAYCAAGLTAVLAEDCGILDRDLLQRLQAIGREARRDHRDRLDPALRQSPHGRIGRGLEPLRATEARLISHHQLPLVEAEPRAQ